MICKIMRIICHGKRYKGIGKVKKYEGLSYDKDIIRMPREDSDMCLGMACFSHFRSRLCEICTSFAPFAVTI